MAIFSFIKPSFLRKLDRKLLVRYPRLWSTKLHFLLYYTILLNIVMALLAWLTPFSTSTDFSPELSYFVCAVIAIVALVIWMIHYNRANIFKQHGDRLKGDEYMHFIVLLAGLYINLITAMTFPTVLTINYAQTVTDQELTDDFDKFNLGMAWFPTHYNYDKFNYDHPAPLRYVTYSVNGGKQYNYMYNQQKRDLNKAYSIWDYSGYNKHELYSNSSYQYSWDLPTRTAYENKSIFDRSRSKKDIIKILSDYLEVNEKYDKAINLDAESLYNYYARNNFTFNFVSNDSLIRRVNGIPFYDENNDRNYGEPEEQFDYLNKWEFYSASYNMEEIADLKMYRIPLFDSDFHAPIFALIFSLTLFIRLFKNMRTRTFIYGILTITLLPILLGLIFATSGFDDDFEIQWVILFLYLIIAFISLGVFKITHYNHFKGICVMLFSLATPFLPIFIWVMIEEWRNMNDYYNYQYWRDYTMYFYYGGLIIYFILLQPVFKRIYTRLWALPVK